MGALKINCKYLSAILMVLIVAHTLAVVLPVRMMALINLTRSTKFS
jgi:hypothetical protein